MGETLVVRNSGGRFSLYVVSAVSPRGDMRFSFIQEPKTFKTFIDFLKQPRRDPSKPILVITDTAYYYHSKQTQRFVVQQTDHISLAFLPAFSSELNPDEQVWNYAKRRPSQRSIFTRLDLKRHLLSILRSIQKQAALIKDPFRRPDSAYIFEALA